MLALELSVPVLSPLVGEVVLVPVDELVEVVLEDAGSVDEGSDDVPVADPSAMVMLVSVGPQPVRLTASAKSEAFRAQPPLILTP